jgi:DNA-binding beta-propeller fold protein YncE
MRRTAVGLFAVVLAASAAAADPPAGYKLELTAPVKGDGGWDYLTVDPAGRRVYVSHATVVDVLDADTGEVRGQIPDTAGVHGIAVAADLGRGFTSNGRADTVTAFDLKTLKPLATIRTGRNPDAILYDPGTKRVFAFNGGSKSATVIDAAEAKVAGTIDLGGKPEGTAADGAGHVFVNLEDTAEVLRLDAQNLKVLDRWSVAPAKLPVSLAVDPATGRLFVGCRSKELLVLDAKTGHAVAKLPIGERVDAGAFDPETKLAFCSCGDGTVTVVRQDGPDKYEAVGQIETKPGSKTMALDPKTHRLYLPAAEFKPAAKGGRPAMVPGTFAVLVFGRS